MRDSRDTPALEAAAADPIDRLARCLSIVGHPFIAIPASVGAVSALNGTGARAASGPAILVIALSACIVAGVKARRFNDFDVSERQRRPGFYALATGATLALGVWLREEPGALGACGVAGAMLAACGALNRWTKASLHTAFALYAAGLWGAWCVSAGLIALPIAASVTWSRVRVGRHSWSEVRAGALVGLAGGAALMAASIPVS